MEECEFFYGFYILGFCKTNLSCEIVQLFHLANYGLYTDNVSQDKGGVVLFIDNQHQSRQRSNLSILSNHTESLFVEILGSQRNILIGVVYKRPHTSNGDFFNYIYDLLSNVQLENKACYIMGDLHIDLLQRDKKKNLLRYYLLVSHLFFFTVV